MKSPGTKVREIAKETTILYWIITNIGSTQKTCCLSIWCSEIWNHHRSDNLCHRFHTSPETKVAFSVLRAGISLKSKIIETRETIGDRLEAGGTRILAIRALNTVSLANACAFFTLTSNHDVALSATRTSIGIRLSTTVAWIVAEHCYSQAFHHLMSVEPCSLRIEIENDSVCSVVGGW